jgi:hypothetical protein
MAFAIALSIWVSNDGDKARAKEIEDSFKALDACRVAHAKLCMTPCQTRDMLAEHINELEEHIFDVIGIGRPDPGQEWMLAPRPWIVESDYGRDEDEADDKSLYW